MEKAENTLRDRFWAELPRLPSGLSLQQREPIVATRPGRGGAAVYDVIDLSTPAGPIPLLAAYQERLLASQVEAVAARLAAVLSQRGERARALGRRDSRSLVPTIITDLANPSVVAACEQRGIALLDRRGTIVLNASPSFIHVVGRAAVEPTLRGRLFSGKASRIVRFLLSVAAPESPPVARSTQTIATACDLSYVYAYGMDSSTARARTVGSASAILLGYSRLGSLRASRRPAQPKHFTARLRRGSPCSWPRSASPRRRARHRSSHWRAPSMKTRSTSLPFPTAFTGRGNSARLSRRSD